jgi:hypothetical protein
MSASGLDSTEELHQQRIKAISHLAGRRNNGATAANETST